MAKYVGFKVGKLHETHQVSEYYCGGCGYPLTDHDSFCPECGGALRQCDVDQHTEPITVNVLLNSWVTEPFDPLVYIDKVFLNEIDIWNYIEKKYYALLEDMADDIEKVKIYRWGVYVFLKTNNKKFTGVKYEIYKRVAR